MPKILLAGKFHPDTLTLLAEHPEVEVRTLIDPTEQQLVDAMPGVHGIVLRTTPFGEAACAMPIACRSSPGMGSATTMSTLGRQPPMACRWPWSARQIRMRFANMPSC